MGKTTELPSELATEVQSLVQAGEYPSFDDAVEALVREALRTRQGGDPFQPERDLPPSERPTDVDADDVNWF